MTTKLSTENAIALESVTKVFGRETAVNELTLSIPKGQAFGFLGQNGSGKTTTIKMIMGLVKRSVGQIYVNGCDPALEGLSVKRQVGYVPEQQFIPRWMRVGEVIAFCRVFYPTWNDKLCTKLLTLFRLDGDKKVKQLSKGMVVKLALILAVAHEPEVLILDEPMAGLDPIAREELLEGVLQTVCDGNQTLLFSSHTLGDVQRLADTIGIIHEGRLLVQGPLDELLRKTKRIRAVLATEGNHVVKPEGLIYERMNHREWQMTVKDFSRDTVEFLKAKNKLEHVEVIDVGLEDIFKDYVRGWRVSV